MNKRILNLKKIIIVKQKICLYFIKKFAKRTLRLIAFGIGIRKLIERRKSLLI